MGVKDTRNLHENHQARGAALCPLPFSPPLLFHKLEPGLSWLLIGPPRLSLMPASFSRSSGPSCLLPFKLSPVVRHPIRIILRRRERRKTILVIAGLKASLMPSCISLWIILLLLLLRQGFYSACEPHL